MHRQDVKNIAEICSRLGVKKAVIAPGSRNTPLTLAFTSQKDIDCVSLTDERSAAFFALGMSQYAAEPVVLICTSGTAVLNFAPAIAEAYYQHIPLIILTADRPAAWIDQADGQTIRQQNIYANYVKESFTLPTDIQKDDTRQSDRTVAQAVDTALQFPRGPVHINVPLDEPLYVNLPGNASLRLIQTVSTESVLSPKTAAQFVQSCSNSSKIMLVVGLHRPDSAFKDLITKLSERNDVIVIAENLSNIQALHVIESPDLLFASLTAQQQPDFIPDLLITIGHSILSKQLKQFLRNHPPKEHWQVESGLPYADTFRSLQFVVPAKADVLIKLILNSPVKPAHSYRDIIIKKYIEVNNLYRIYLSKLPFCDMKIIPEILDKLTGGKVIHISNSTPIRLSQLTNTRSDMEYYCNRGTSGIEGSVSTAAGASYVSGKETVLITGDLSFIYDSNGLWNRYLKGKLKIIVLNNCGANIFRIIGNEEITAGCQEFFDAPHQVNLKALTEAYGHQYLSCERLEDLKSSLSKLQDITTQTAILEIKTRMENNVEAYKGLFKYLKENIQ